MNNNIVIKIICYKYTVSYYPNLPLQPFLASSRNAGEEHCVTMLKMAARETNYSIILHKQMILSIQ